MQAVLAPQRPQRRQEGHLVAARGGHGSGAGSGGGSLRVASLDAGLLCYGEPTAFPTPFAPADLSYGASWNLWNNIWGPNYPQWYPFDPKDSNIEYRFSVSYSSLCKVMSCFVFSSRHLTPVTNHLLSSMSLIHCFCNTSG